MLPAIRFINLERATARRAFMEAQGRRLGLALERVRASEGHELPAAEVSRLAASWERDLSHAEIGCFLSHRGEWERVAREGRPALILEDDAVLSRRLPAVIEALGAIGDADLVNLEDVGRRRFLAQGEGEAVADGIRRVRCLRDKAGAGGYVIWPDGARRLLREAGSRAFPADACLHGSGLRAFVCEPPLVLQAEIVEAYGARSAVSSRSFIQPAAGDPRKPRARNLAQIARRAATQVRLLPFQARRLTDVVYRRVAVEIADFS